MVGVDRGACLEYGGDGVLFTHLYSIRSPRYSGLRSSSIISHSSLSSPRVSPPYVLTLPFSDAAMHGGSTEEGDERGDGRGKKELDAMGTRIYTGLTWSVRRTASLVSTIGTLTSLIYAGVWVWQ